MPTTVSPLYMGPFALTSDATAPMPVTDDRARLIARGAKAGVVIVVDVEVRKSGRVRGTRLTGAAGRARVRVIDVEGQRVAEADAKGAGHGNATEAVARAAADAARRAAHAVAAPTVRHWPLSAAANEMLVEIEGVAFSTVSP